MRCILFFLIVFNFLRTVIVIYCCICIGGKKNQWLPCRVCSQRRTHIKGSLLIDLDFFSDKSCHFGDLSRA